MSPKKEARLLTNKDVVVANGKGHKIKDVKDFGNRIVVTDEDDIESRYDFDAEVEVE